MEKVFKFQDLQVWQEGHQLVLAVYRATQSFPSDERFGLVSQMRRAAVSVPANIVEGFNRRGLADKLHFYNISQGSLEELKYFFILAQDLHYLPDSSAIMGQADQVGRLLYGLMDSTRKRSRV